MVTLCALFLSKNGWWVGRVHLGPVAIGNRPAKPLFPAYRGCRAWPGGLSGPIGTCGGRGGQEIRPLVALIPCMAFDLD